MTEITATKIRSTITDDEFGGFRITIPPSEGVRWGYGCALALWGFVMIFTLYYVATSPAHLRLGGLKFLVTCTLFGIFIGLIAAANGILREVVIIEGKQLVMRKEFAILSKERAFELAEVRNLRPLQQNESYAGVYRPKSVGFDYKGRTYHFGEHLSEHEIARLIKTIRSRFPIRDDWREVDPLPVST